MVFLVYFVSGILVMKYYRGAVGKELIPHHNFWIDLPFLIKVISYNNYDNIM